MAAAALLLLGLAAIGAPANARQSASRLPPIVHRGAGLPMSSEVPLLIALHPRGTDPARMQTLTGFDSVADQKGFVVAYLDFTPPVVLDSANVSYIGSMIDQLTKSENIDPDRVYVTGFSEGGYDTFRSACDLSDKVAAVAIVSNVMAPLSRQPCRLSRPVSELTIAGTRDLIPIKQTPSSPVSVDQTTAAWRALNGCSSQSQTTRVGPTDEEAWSDCNDGSSVGEYVVNGGSHNWPGAPGSSGINASYDGSAAVWAFLSQHTRSNIKTAAAKLLTARVSRGSRRTVGATATVAVSTVSAQMSLTLRGRMVASKTVKLVRGRGRALALAVPRAARAGTATLKVTFVDPYGRKSTFTRKLKVPQLAST
jgi:polyhydroxybutyrate depolymerase